MGQNTLFFFDWGLYRYVHVGWGRSGVWALGSSETKSKRVTGDYTVPVLLRELGSGKVGYNKYELFDVMVRKTDGTYLAGYIYI